MTKKQAKKQMIEIVLKQVELAKARIVMLQPKLFLTISKNPI